MYNVQKRVYNRIMEKDQIYAQIENIHRRFESLSEDLEGAVSQLELDERGKNAFEAVQNASTDFSNRLQEFVVYTDQPGPVNPVDWAAEILSRIEREHADLEQQRIAIMAEIDVLIRNREDPAEWRIQVVGELAKHLDS